ncbi:hypothetical protein F5X99DRAFT_218778 [Biscogniauxia marginata]|nr:hypothetical protein F5X99DRAFT_218778 [Biscogniauxia marginata]
MEINIPRTSAWKAKQTEIEDFIRSSLDPGLSRGVYIQAAHGSGKSSTLLAHVADMHLQGEAGPVLYISRASEAKNAFDYLATCRPDLSGHVQSGVLDSDKRPITVCNYEQFTRHFAHSNAKLVAHIVLLLDVEVRPTVWGELCIATILKLASAMDVGGKGLTPLSTVCLAAHVSRRMQKAFEKRLRPMGLIEVPDINPVLKISYLEGEDNTAKIRDYVHRVLSFRSARVIISGASVYTLSRIAEDYVLIEEDSDLSFLLSDEVRDRVFGVDSNISASLPVRNLQLYVSMGSTDAILFDTLTSQFVEMPRELCTTELKREQSWVLKCDQPLGDVEFVSVLGPNKWNAPIVADPLEPAWHGDLPELALRLVDLWPGAQTGSWPTRQVPDVFTLAEIFGRLIGLGCLKREHQGHALTSLGRAVINNLQTIPDMDLHTAVFIASAQNHKSPVAWAILLVGIVLSRARYLCRVPDAGIPDRHLLISRCSEIGRRHGHKGSAWVLVGILLRLHQEKLIDPLADIINTSGVELSHRVAYGILDSVNKLGVSMGFDNSTPSTFDQVDLLTDDQVVEVEMEMMKAWMHRTVFFNTDAAASIPQLDCVSMMEVSVFQEKEFLEVEEARVMEDTVEHGGFFAIYERLSKTAYNGRKYYVVSGLTRIPRHLYTTLESKGERFPECVITTYPMHVRK